MREIAAAIGEWLRAHWAEVVTAVATMATASAVWLDRKDRKKNEEPFVQCNLIPSQNPGWTRIQLVVRNFNPYSIDVVELRVKKPVQSALFSESEARGAQSQFVATNASPKLTAAINVEVQPAGTIRAKQLGSGSINSDEIQRDFYYSPGPGRSGRIKFKMVLIWEVRSRDVRTKEIPINRTITL
jgi:hypothetical protein